MKTKDGLFNLRGGPNGCVLVRSRHFIRTIISNRIGLWLFAARSHYFLRPLGPIYQSTILTGMCSHVQAHSIIRCKIVCTFLCDFHSGLFWSFAFRFNLVAVPTQRSGHAIADITSKQSGRQRKFNWICSLSLQCNRSHRVHRPLHLFLIQLTDIYGEYREINLRHGKTTICYVFTLNSNFLSVPAAPIIRSSFRLNWSVAAANVAYMHTVYRMQNAKCLFEPHVNAFAI